MAIKELTPEASALRGTPEEMKLRGENRARLKLAAREVEGSVARAEELFNRPATPEQDSGREA